MNMIEGEPNGSLCIAFV